MATYPGVFERFQYPHSCCLVATFSSVDLDGSHNTATIDVSEYRLVGYQLDNATGSHTDHVVRVEVSNDDALWWSAGYSSGGGQNYVEENIVVGTRYMRIDVSTAETGGASTGHIIVVAKG